MSISSRLAATACAAFVIFCAAAAVRSADVTRPSLDSNLPGDVASDAAPEAFDTFSWQSFVAINSPADGSPIGTRSDALTQWEASWMSDFQVLDSSGKPPPWGTPPDYQKPCDGATYPPPKGTRNLVWLTKGGELGHFVTPNNGPLIDQNGNLVLFEILVNKPMYDFIAANKLSTLSGQKAFAGRTLAFPESSTAEPDAGAMVLKAAWKEIDGADDPSQFHTAMAFIRDPTTDGCRLAKMGLVGLHISRKTANYPKWIWSTFEHRANAPTLNVSGKGPYNFNSGKVLGASGANRPPEKSVLSGDGPRTPVEVVRFIPVTSTAMDANSDYQAALQATPGKSVFANYMLVGTQHPTDNDDPASKSGDPSPQFLANTTMETYIQGDSQGQPAPTVTSNCGECHAGANLAANGGWSDFSYILQRVKAQ
jgi:hypothetical protein